jgi:SAM-dependent methyltransferase
MIDDISQHQFEIQANRNHWQRKPLLGNIYRRFYELIKTRLQRGVSLELGSGIGQIKSFIPDCITSDLFPNPGIDRVESAYALSFEDGILNNIILFDVWHHLEYPGAALRECYRVLAPGGRVIIFEPAMGALPRAIYRLLHHEPLGFGESICWEPPVSFDLGNAPYFAAQARAWRIFHNGECSSKHLAGWRIIECTAWSDFAYLASGGFSKPALYPSFCLAWIEMLDRLLTRFHQATFAARMLVVLEKQE